MTPAPIALWTVPVPELAGVARHVLDVVDSGIPGCRIVVACPPGALAERLRAGGHAVLTGPLSPADGLPTAARTLRSMLRALRPAVAHSHLAFADAALALAAADPGSSGSGGAGPALVTTEHGISGDPGVYHASRVKAGGRALAHHLRLRRFDHAIAVSRATRQAMIDRWRLPIECTVIPNGVDGGGADRFPAGAAAAGPTAGPRVLSLSRLAPEKRIDTLLAAFARVRAEHPGARLTVAGTGELEPALREQVRRLGLGGAVDFPGFVDPGAALDSHDVVVQLSAWENCSYTLLDAAAHGIGVVATDVGGNPEILPDSCLVAGNGAAGPDAAEVARALLEQWREPDRRPGREHLPGSVAQMTERIAQVYRGVARGARPFTPRTGEVPGSGTEVNR